jgi:alpha-amylase
MARKTLAASFALVAGLAVSVTVPPGTAAASPPGTKDVTAVLF